MREDIYKIDWLRWETSCIAQPGFKWAHLTPASWVAGIRRLLHHPQQAVDYGFRYSLMKKLTDFSIFSLWSWSPLLLKIELHEKHGWEKIQSIYLLLLLFTILIVFMYMFVSVWVPMPVPLQRPMESVGSPWSWSYRHNSDLNASPQGWAAGAFNHWGISSALFLLIVRGGPWPFHLELKDSGFLKFFCDFNSVLSL